MEPVPSVQQQQAPVMPPASTSLSSQEPEEEEGEIEIQVRLKRAT